MCLVAGAFKGDSWGSRGLQGVSRASTGLQRVSEGSRRDLEGLRGVSGNFWEFKGYRELSGTFKGILLPIKGALRHIPGVVSISEALQEIAEVLKWVPVVSGCFKGPQGYFRRS